MTFAINSVPALALLTTAELGQLLASTRPAKANIRPLARPTTHGARAERVNILDVVLAAKNAR